MTEETFKANHLIETELDYELLIRKLTSSRPVAEKRKILSRVLAKEKTSPDSLVILADYDFDLENEKGAIERTLLQIGEAILDFTQSGGNANDHAFLRIKSRIVHITNRVKRLLKLLDIPNKVNDDQRDELTKFHSEYYATCFKLEADLFEGVQVGEQPRVEPLQPVINIPPTIVNCSRNNASVSDLNIKFNGDPKSLYSFLESITEFSQSRHITEDDLFNSAVELFSGDAFVWYRSIKSLVNNWQGLVQRLKSDFLNSDIDEDIWEQIKKRKQKNNETIALFIAHMQTLFNRLSRPPVESSRIKYIRSNLLPEYIGQFALIDIVTIEQLLNLGKKLEEAKNIQRQNSKIQYVSSYSNQEHRGHNKFYPQSHENKSNNDFFQIGSPKNKFGSNNSKKSYNKISNKNYAKNSSSNAVVETECHPSTSKVESVSKLTCWNCGGENHRFTSCTAKRKIFCFKCGLENVKLANCPKCLKN